MSQYQTKECQYHKQCQCQIRKDQIECRIAMLIMIECRE